MTSPLSAPPSSPQVTTLAPRVARLGRVSASLIRPSNPAGQGGPPCPLLVRLIAESARHGVSTGAAHIEESMRYTGTHSLAAQHGSFGYFAEVSLTVEVADGSAALRIEFDDEVDKSWRPGAQFGVAYAFEKSPMAQVRGRQVSVRITGIRGHVVDTTEVPCGLCGCAGLLGGGRSATPGWPGVRSSNCDGPVPQVAAVRRTDATAPSPTASKPSYR